MSRRRRSRRAVAGPLVVRPARRHDHPALAALDATCRPHAPWSAERYARFLGRDGRYEGFVALRRKRILGSVLVRPLAGALRLVRLNVAGEFRRRGIGIGRALVGRLRTHLFDHGLSLLEVPVPERDLASQLFFKAVGWTCTDIEPGRGPQADARYRFTLTLTTAVLAARAEPGGGGADVSRL